MTKNVLDLKMPRTSVPELSADQLSVETKMREAPAVDEEDADAAALAADAGGPDELMWEAHAPYSVAAQRRRRFLTWGLVGAGLVTAVLQASWSTGLVVLAGVGAWALRERHAGVSKVHIGSRGCTIDGHHIPHAQLASFDLHELRDGSVHLSLRTDARLSRQIHVPLGDQNPDDVHALLSRFVPEETHPIPFWEWWMRKS